MHEFSFMYEVITLIRQAALNNRLIKVNKVVLQIGELSCIQKRALEFAFDIISRGTPAQGAKLEIKIIQATAYCENCDLIFTISHFAKCCPQCGDFSQQIITGYEMLLTEIEGEEDEKNYDK